MSVFVVLGNLDNMAYSFEKLFTYLQIRNKNNSF